MPDSPAAPLAPTSVCSVLFADLRGSTGLFERMGNAQATAAVTECLGAMVPLVAARRGRVVKTLGDGLMAVFLRSSDAVQCAQAMHDTAAHFDTRERPSSSIVALRLQVTVARGETMEVDGDRYGDAVNVAARLLDHAGDNETLVTAEVWNDLPAPLRQDFRPLDRIALRGREEPVLVLVKGAEDLNAGPATQFGDESDATLQVATSSVVRLSRLDASAVFSRESGSVILGRDQTSHFRIEDQRVSRSHARIDWRGSHVELTDLSFNGTHVRFSDGSVLSLRRGSCPLHGAGVIALGSPLTDPTGSVVNFHIQAPGQKV